MYQSYPPPEKAADATPQQLNMYRIETPQPEMTGSTMNLVTEPAVERYTTLYILSILATIFCTSLPCGMIGLMHIIAARSDASRGSLVLAEKKRKQGLCWTAWACGIGWGIVVITIIICAVSLSVAASAGFKPSMMNNFNLDYFSTTTSYYNNNWNNLM
ncbi:uncharacterized protein [Watersipora subatra]|uniref:uncharacterized protein n=1 Tax=Watersipora subatra TaxID=2589382 RepID=UPI00355B456B